MEAHLSARLREERAGWDHPDPRFAFRISTNCRGDDSRRTGHGRSGLGTADCLRQRCRSAAGEVIGAPEGDRSTSCARGKPWETDTAVADRSHTARGASRRHRAAVCLVGDAISGYRNFECAACCVGHARSRSRSRPSCVWLYLDYRPVRRNSVRSRARA